MNERPIKTRKTKEDYVGRIFGKLAVLNRDMSKVGRGIGSYWVCKCECGKICSISRHSFNHGTKSCGCLQKEVAIDKAIPNAGSNKRSWLKKYKRRAKENKVDFALTDDQFYDICSRNCFYCDSRPTPRSHGYVTKKDVGQYFANGIDRIDPNKGYLLENCVPCCKVCNFMKTNKSMDFFISKILEIANNIRKKDVISKS